MCIQKALWLKFLLSVEKEVGATLHNSDMTYHFSIFTNQCYNFSKQGYRRKQSSTALNLIYDIFPLQSLVINIYRSCTLNGKAVYTCPLTPENIYASVTQTFS